MAPLLIFIPHYYLQMLGYGELLYQIGMANRGEADYVNDQTQKMADYINAEKYSEAFSVCYIYIQYHTLDCIPLAYYTCTTTRYVI